MSYIRETFYCINDSTKNIHLRWQNKYYVYAYTIIFMLHNLKKRRKNSVSFNYLIRPSFLRRLINLFQPSERLSAFCFVFSKFQ